MTNQMPKSALKSINPPPELAGKILASIHVERLRAVRRNLVMLFGISICSLSSCIYFAVALIKSFASSGFYDYLSLVISDVGNIGSFWGELLVSLAESLPAFTFAVFLSAMGVFVWSGAKTFKSMAILKTV